MITVGMVDMNTRAKGLPDDELLSIVARWIGWEFERQAFYLEHDPIKAKDCDVVLVVYSGAITFFELVTKGLRKYKIEPFTAKRKKPYLIIGGGIYMTPQAALKLGNAVCLGEGYGFIRKLIDVCRNSNHVEAVKEWAIADPHTIEASQLDELEIDPQKPWLYKEKAPILASPDDFIDWDVPPIQADDNIMRVIASKGCHNKCLFCSTSWGQRYQKYPDQAKLARLVDNLYRHGHRSTLITNDPADLEAYQKITVPLGFQSFTVKSIRSEENLQRLARQKIKTTRLGVEGVSERIRWSVNKPVSNDELVRFCKVFSDKRALVHLFFIKGMPLEDDADWECMKELYIRLWEVITQAITRFKFTAFNPAPPAPLAKWVSCKQSFVRYKKLADWRMNNYASRHTMFIGGIGEKYDFDQPLSSLDNHMRNISAILDIPFETAQQIVPDYKDFDLAPTYDDFCRMKHEIVDWPVSKEARWKLGEIYVKRMAGLEANRCNCLSEEPNRVSKIELEAE